MDIFLSDNPSFGNVFVVDQINEDGSFDEHKVMYGFSSVDEAKEAYLANYSPGWKGLGNITEVSKEGFKKWIDSSKRKTKAFGEYKIAQEHAELEIKPDELDGEVKLDHRTVDSESDNDNPDKFDYDAVVATFKTHVKNHPDIYQVSNLEDAERLKDIGVPGHVIDVIKKDLENDNLTGVYYPKRKMMIVFPPHIKNEAELEKSLWHEAVHYILKGSDIHDKERLMQTCLNYVKDNHPTVYAKATNGYSEEEAPEESVAYLVEDLLEKHGADKSINSKFDGNSDLANLITQLFNHLKDENGREHNQLRKSGFTGTDRGTEGKEYGKSESGSRSSENDKGSGGERNDGDSEKPRYRKSEVVEGARKTDEESDEHDEENYGKLTIRNVNQKIYDIAGPFMSRLYKNGSLGRVLVGDHADIDQLKAHKEYKLVLENLVPLRKKMEDMIAQCTDAARVEVESMIADIDYALDYYSKLSQGKDVWRKSVSPRFRIIDAQKSVPTEKVITAKIEELAESLRTSVRIARSVDDVPGGTAKRAIEKGRNIKGWYDTDTGGVVVYLPNTDSVADAQATILHEVVAHKGLRDMLGKDAFDELCGKVFDALPKDVRGILMEEYKDRLIAGDEYMASIAEKGIEPSLWEKIKSFVREAFRKIGVDLSMNDNDIKYLLWKSKNRLMNRDNGMDLVNKVAVDADMREHLGIGEYKRIKSEVEDVSSKYGKKSYRMFDKDVLPVDLKELSPYLEEGTPLQDIADYLNVPETLAVYIRGIDKIYIFANKMSDFDRKGIEKVLFHENVHASLNDMYGDYGRRTIVNLFYGKADKSLDKYKEKARSIYNELNLKRSFSLGGFMKL